MFETHRLQVVLAVLCVVLLRHVHTEKCAEMGCRLGCHRVRGHAMIIIDIAQAG